MAKFKLKPYELAMREMSSVQRGPGDCTHPPERLSAWHARDDSAPEGVAFCVCCNMCGSVLAGARRDATSREDAEL